MTATRRRLLAAGVGVAGVATGMPSLGSRRVDAQATPSATAQGGTITYEIPGDRVFPEGIAYDPAGDTFYVGSTEDGAIYRGDLTTGVVERFLPGGEDGRTEVTGLKVDDVGRLLVCGRRTGRIFVYDITSGALLARFGNGLSDQTLINDAAITPDGMAYVTDSFAPSLYRVDLTALTLGTSSDASAGATAGEQKTEVALDFRGTALAYVDGFNANGIVASADGRILLVVQFATGQLFRLELESGVVAEVTLTDGDLRGGDGMALDGATLWALLDTTGELVHLELNDTLTEGAIVRRFVDPTFDYPTTLALVGDGTALIVNSQLDMADGGGSPTLPFTVTRIVLPV